MMITDSLESFEVRVKETQSIERFAFHVVNYSFSHDSILLYFKNSDGAWMHYSIFKGMAFDDVIIGAEETREQVIHQYVNNLFPRARYYEAIDVGSNY